MLWATGRNSSGSLAMLAAILRASSFDLSQCGPITQALRKTSLFTTRCWPKGGSDDGYSAHEEGRFLLGANSTTGRPCRRRLRISGKIYLVVPLRSASIAPAVRYSPRSFAPRLPGNLRFHLFRHFSPGPSHFLHHFPMRFCFSFCSQTETLSSKFAILIRCSHLEIPPIAPAASRYSPRSGAPCRG